MPRKHRHLIIYSYCSHTTESPPTKHRLRFRQILAFSKRFFWLYDTLSVLSVQYFVQNCYIYLRDPPQKPPGFVAHETTPPQPVETQQCDVTLTPLTPVVFVKSICNCLEITFCTYKVLILIIWY